MAVEHPWWKRWLCYLSCEWFSKPVLGKRFCVCLYDAAHIRKKVKREYRGKDGGLRFLALPKTIAFMGLDGSGKTTQATNLQDFLKHHKIPYTYVHLPSCVPLAKIKLRKVASSCENKGKNKPSWFVSLLRQKMYSLGIIWIYLTRFLPSWVRGRIVICDRWFYDELIHMRYRKMDSFIGIISFFTPRPGMLLYLSVDPKTAMARSPEADIDYFLAKKAMYELLARKKKAEMIEVTTKEKTWDSIEERLKNRFGHVLWKEG